MSVRFHNTIKDGGEDFRHNPKSIEKFQFVYHFLPHPNKKKRASLLSQRAIFIYCVVLLVLIGLFKVIPKYLPGVLGYASNISVNELFSSTNIKRKDETGGREEDQKVEAVAADCGG